MTLEEANAIVKKHTAGLVAKWDKTGLLDGLKNDIDKSDMAVLVESQPRQLHVDDMTPEEKEFSEAMFVISNSKRLDETLL